MLPWEREADMNYKDKEDSNNREKQARWQSRHREENKERCKDWRDSNPGYFTDWNHKNPDKVKEKQKRQYATEEHKTYMREYMREYRKAKKESAKKGESSESDDSNS